ncbi:c-type cytochrome [Propionicicella superfundia]|uniref:cytochrome bc1 complex diheme cytochrome c subunit n=1 Tax=Propionicicella superfundia TaxID=348582 RepID=UPI00042026AD|nr:c-type cytochrome [Propionicicella superfundia]
MKNRRPRRRSALIRPLAIVLALFVLGLTYAALQPATQSMADGSKDQIAAGKALFTQNCSSCHGLNGEGTSQAPSLIGVGSAAVDFQVGTGRMPMANQGQQAPRKAGTYTSDETAQLAAYVASLGTGTSTPDSGQYNPAGLTDEEIARGGELFRSNCSACHNFEGAGGALPEGVSAPSLQGVEAIHIWEAMRTGPGQMPVFGQNTITDEDARAIIGYLTSVEAEPSGGLSLGGIGPVSEGFWGFIIGIGGLSLFAVWIAAKGARAK